MGRVIHFEIHADDPPRAVDFYTKVLGWSVSQFGDMEYWLVSTGEGPGIDGAILPRSGERPAVGAPVVGAVITAEVADLDATLETALGAGAAMALDKMPIPGVGTVAYVLDTEANVLGLLQPED